MRAILDRCGDIPLEHVPDGTIILGEGQTTGRLYVLAQGRIEVLRGDTQVAVLDEPGSLVGEMSVLLGAPHTATARATPRSMLSRMDRTFSAPIPTSRGWWLASWRTV